MSLTKLLIGIVLISGFHSCIDQIPITINESVQEYLIVDAELRDNETLHSIKIKLNTPLSNDFQADQPVNDAQVYVVENNGDRFDFANNNDLGIYWNNKLKLKEGNNYKLYIKYKGIEYSSGTETLLPSVPILEIRTSQTKEERNNSFGNIITTDLVNVYADSNFPENQDNYIRYTVKGIFEYREIGSRGNLNPLHCFVQETIDLDNISLASNKEIIGGKLRNQLVLQKVIDYRFAVNYCMRVYQERISKNAYEFWSLVKNEYSRTGDIFEKPPGVIRGNISEINDSDISAVGIFSVIGVDSFLYLIKPKDVSSPQPQCRPFPQGPESCSNCLLLSKSTLVQPECFK